MKDGRGGVEEWEVEERWRGSEGWGRRVKDGGGGVEEWEAEERWRGDGVGEAIKGKGIYHNLSGNGWPHKVHVR